jgi:hypothetical protein
MLDLRSLDNHPAGMKIRFVIALFAAASLCRAAETNSTRDLPAGHPPINASSPALPPGHPSVGTSAQQLPTGHPTIDMSSQTLPDEAKAKVETPQWTVPTNWTAGASSAMRIATFKVAGDDKHSAEIAVTVFPGDVGGPLANINRWRGQMNLTPIKQEDVAGITTPIEANGVKGTVVNIDAGAKRMLVATLPHAGNSWFFKMTGDAAVVEAQKENFLQFVKSVKF